MHKKKGNNAKKQKINKKMSTKNEDKTVNPTEVILKEVETIQPRVEKKKQKISISYLMKQFGEMRMKLVQEQLITDKENETLMIIRENAIKKWVN